MIPTSITAKNIFKGMSAEKKKAILNEIINVQGIKSPRTKADKDYDKVRGTNSPRRGEQNFKPLLFEHCVRLYI